MKGHITTEFTVWCGKCTEWFQDSYPSLAIAKKGFKKLGWVDTKEHGWLCPNDAKGGNKNG